MTLRRCPVKYCPNLTNGGPCQTHQLTTAQRGYGSDHQRQRDRMQIIIDRGQAICARSLLGQCLEPTPTIAPGSAWAMDHNGDRTGYLGASHKRCNDAADATAHLER